MFRKVVFGLLWILVLNVGIGFVIATAAGVLAGIGEPDPQRAFELGHTAGASVAWLKPYVFMASVLVVVVGAANGWLPGTRQRASTEKDISLRLRELADLHKQGFITDDEFAKKKADFIDNM